MLASLLWALGALGGTGAVLFVASLFVPTVAVAVKAVLDFLRSPLGTIVGGAALGLYLFSAGWVAGDLHGTAAVKLAWRADTAHRAVLAEQKQVAVDKSVDADVATKLTELERENVALKQKVQDALDAKHPVCRLDADTARRLRDIQ